MKADSRMNPLSTPDSLPRCSGLLRVLCVPLVFVAACTPAPTLAPTPSPQSSAPSPQPSLPFSPSERALIATLSPLPPPPPDPTNRVADDPAAARLGQFLFFDPRLSRDGKVSCASCHDPGKQFADGLPIPEKFSRSLRHTPALWNVAYNRWFFWDGRADTLWSQALGPLENPSEHAGDRVQFAALVETDPELRRAYAQVFGPPAPGSAKDSPDRVFANLGKAIAAYERRLVSRRAPFDVFAEGLADGDPAKLAALSPAAQRGLKLFIGPANCRSCHHGPNFTDGEFHDTGVSRLAPGAPQDAGRFAGVNLLIQSPFNSQGAFADDPAGRPNRPTAFLVNSVERKGQFKTPTLRNAAVTAPYMHRGQLATLHDVVRFYSRLELPPAPPPMPAPAGAPAGHSHGGGQEHILAPLHLSKDESDALVSFLESLTDTQVDPALLRPPPSPWTP